MLPNEIDVVIGGTTHTTTLVSLTDGRSIRREYASGILSLPTTLTIATSSSGKGKSAVDSYLLRLDRALATEVDQFGNVLASQTLSAYVVVKVPKALSNSLTEAANTAAGVKNLMQAVISGSSNAVMNRILKGEL